MNLRLPLVVILGATGSGKTKLSLDLAKKFGGEILGADSMQIYTNMDIISAKPTPEERSVAPHHLIDILHPQEICTVVDYRNRALPIISDLFSKNKLPIIVGGTNYYIEALLWKILIEEPGNYRKNDPGQSPNKDHELSSEELHSKLLTLDPVMAKRLHPNNKRKNSQIIRALEVHEQKGRLISDIFKEQKLKGGNAFGGGLRYTNAIIFWLQWDQATLNERINKRVDTMIEEGVLEELSSFHKLYNEERMQTNDVNSEPDYTKGIFQMIGFKEFHKYLMLTSEEKFTENGKLLLQQGIDDLKMVTRRYAKKQSKWVKNRFLAKTDREVPPVYCLTTDDLDKWDEEIINPAINIIQNYIEDVTCEYKSMLPIEINSNPNCDDETHFCEICNRVFVGKFQWEIHVKSNKHKRRNESLKRSTTTTASIC